FHTSVSPVFYSSRSFFSFFYNDTATTELYTLSLHDALPIYRPAGFPHRTGGAHPVRQLLPRTAPGHRTDPLVRSRGVQRAGGQRSEEHTSELQSRENLVCRLLLEKKKKRQIKHIKHTNK